MIASAYCLERVSRPGQKWGNDFWGNVGLPETRRWSCVTENSGEERAENSHSSGDLVEEVL